jgi:hypothetical protein
MTRIPVVVKDLLNFAEAISLTHDPAGAHITRSGEPMA